MRDPHRIEHVLDLVGQLWERYPDWRLGQLLSNMAQEKDVFYLEDDVLVGRVLGMLEGTHGDLL